jgi:phenylacetic acid degradation operon negative regulatory protein
MSNKTLRNRADTLVETLSLTPKKILGTVYGDMLLPHSQSIWLSSLVKVANCFGINDSQARTATLRLGYEGWLDQTRIGKYTYYSASVERARDLREYYPRIYGNILADTSGHGFLLLVDESTLTKKTYKALRKQLLWLGAGQLAAYIFVMTSKDSNEMRKMFEIHELMDKVLLVKMVPGLDQNILLTQNLAAKAWNTDILDKKYRDFLHRFRPLWQAIDRIKDDIDPETALIVRTLMMTDYRSLVIRDPGLPSALLPQPWSGHNAYNLCRNIYQRLLEPSEIFLREVIRTADGDLSHTPNEVYERFGGIRN